MLLYAAAQMSSVTRPMLVVIRLAASRQPEYSDMLETIAIVLLILWALGLVSSYTAGGFIHILLVAALVIIVARFIQRRA